ncbi:MAG: hypothetical protein J7M19_09505 [Planctomycetes bacterium]|nr:hypothetical protein [Planctomycetota bacterium]
MNNWGKVFFLHFEKIFAGIFGLALLYSVVFHGPWVYGTDQEERLNNLVVTLEGRPEITAGQVPKTPDFISAFAKAGRVTPQQPLGGALFWEVLPWTGGVEILPPVDVAAAPELGYVAVSWDQNSNQPKTDGKLTFTGVEIARAMVLDDRPEVFETVTTAGERPYLTPAELLKRARKLKPELRVQQQRAGRTAGPEGLTADELLSAMVDGEMTVRQARRTAANAVRSGEMAASERLRLNENFRMIAMLWDDYRREIRQDENRVASDEEILRRALADLGVRSSDQGRRTTTQRTQAAQAPKKRVVSFGDVRVFYDEDVNPDVDYTYRVRFWGENLGEEAGTFRQSDWTDIAASVSPKPDTEFALTGGSLEGKGAWIKVRKWMPATKEWISKAYQVVPGEGIGCVETILKRNASTGAVVMEKVDFSTECVLLAFRKRLRVVSKGSGNSGEEGVDSRGALVYPMLQIVYSDRRGDLRIKWQPLADEG